ncbi:MAG TPA: hypothetical protein VFI42_17490 [Thermomicrobiaceae bacterium]|nr:hypothetical protein [Thermomicrobiaceae bacterium]
MSEPEAGVDWRGEAERVAAALAAQFGEAFDFGPASLRRLDAALAEWLSFAEVYAAPGESLEHLARPLAAYVGEVLVRQAGGRWLEPAEEATIVLPAGAVLALEDLARLVLSRAVPPNFTRLLPG